MDIELPSQPAPSGRGEWFLEAWPAEAQDACAPEGGVPAWVRLEMSVAEQWAYAAEASS